jgi:hypothetical protein
VWTSHTLQYAMSGGYYSSSSSGYSAPTQETTPTQHENNQGFVQVPNDGH